MAERLLDQVQGLNAIRAPWPGIDITTDSTNETSIIYYDQNDTGALSMPDLCDSSAGTYAPVN